MIHKTLFQGPFNSFDSFNSDIIKPVFGEITPFKKSFKAQLNEAEKQIMEDVICWGEIDLATHGDQMQFYEVLLQPKVKLSVSRVSIQAFIRRELLPYTAALIVFHYPHNPTEWRISFVSKGRNATDATSAKRYTYLVGDDQACRTVTKRFDELTKKPKTLENITEAFSVDKLSDDFFETYRNIYADFVQHITGKRYVKEKGKWIENTIQEPDEQLQTAFDGDEKSVRDYVKKMMGRLVFLQFLQKKGWLGVPADKPWGEGDQHFLKNLFAKSNHKDDFLDEVLEPLLFETLNDGERANEVADARLGENIKIPYLNGGLFESDALDKRKVIFKAELFENLFQFFSEYNFTIDENDPNDAEVGVDPEMLGRIFENLLEDNKDKGAFYTPKEIVQYMCRESLIAYLTTDNETIADAIKQLVLQHKTNALPAEHKQLLLTKLKAVKVCDPAIGSGAFPMGMLHEIYQCIVALDGKAENTVDIKKHIIQNSIYGVDLEKGAVDIARLRFWLALVVDEEKPQPLPNLDYKIMQGNSILESYEGVDLSKIIVKNNKNTIKDLFGNITNAQMTLSWTENEQSQDDILLSMKDYFNTTNHYKKEELRNKIDKQILNYIITYCSGNKQIAEKVKHLDSDKKPYFLWHLYFADVFSSLKKGFDIIIGNPPYVEAKKLKPIAFQLKDYNVYSGTADLSSYFFEKGLNLCAEKGYLCFISTNKFFNTGYGKPLREFILKNKIDQMINFEQVEVFDKVLVSSVICGISKETPKKSNKFIYQKFYKLNHKEFKHKFLDGIENRNFYKQSNLNSNEWSFADNTGLALKLKIETNASVLEKIEGITVNRGITTGFNDAFLIDEKNKNNFIENDSNSIKIIKPILQGRNVRKWKFKKSTEYILQTGFDTNINNEYPFIYSHLEQFGNELKSRSDQGKNWWNLRACKYYSDFELPEKIIWGLTADKWAFAYDSEQHYLPSNGYILTSKIIPIKYILALLNSNLLKYYFGFIGIMTAGGAYTLKHSTILQLPIKIAKNQKKFIEIVDEILYLKNQNSDYNAFEEELILDAYIYKLYDLTYEEVKVVDPEFGLSEEEYAMIEID